MDKVTERQQIYDSTLAVLSTPNIVQSENTDITSIVAELIALSSEVNESACHLQKPLQEAKSKQKQKNDDLDLQLSTAVMENKSIENEATKVAEEKESLQKSLEEIHLKLEEQRTESANLLKEAVKVIPKNQHICSLLRNITKIEWDIATCKGSSATKGILKTENGIQPFHFDTSDSGTIQENLWGLMKEGEKFASVIESDLT